MEFDLKLADGTIVRWEGRTGELAAQAYADSHAGSLVIAWREPPQPIGFYGRGTRILQPGDYGY